MVFQFAALSYACSLSLSLSLMKRLRWERCCKIWRLSWIDDFPTHPECGSASPRHFSIFVYKVTQLQYESRIIFRPLPFSHSLPFFVFYLLLVSFNVNCWALGVHELLKNRCFVLLESFTLVIILSTLLHSQLVCASRVVLLTFFVCFLQVTLFSDFEGCCRTCLCYVELLWIGLVARLSWINI